MRKLLAYGFAIVIFLALIRSLWDWSWPITIFIGFGALYLYWRNLRFQHKDKQRYTEAITETILLHVSALNIKKMQSVTTDSYGNILVDKWEKEKLYFYKAVIQPMLFKRFSIRAPDEDLTFSNCDTLIDQTVDNYKAKSPLIGINVKTLNPYQFEAYCAQLLSNSGWVTRVTKGSGDQGIDIIASKKGYKAVFQIKLYSLPIGNKAVQEAIAGRSFESADLAYVVSNASYTPSAIALANRSNVRLLHYSQLIGLEP